MKLKKFNFARKFFFTFYIFTVIAQSAVTLGCDCGTFIIERLPVLCASTWFYTDELVSGIFYYSKLYNTKSNVVKKLICYQKQD